MQGMRRIARVLAWFSALGMELGLGTALCAQQPITRETVIKAWKDRQENVRTVRLAWTERTTIPRGYVSETNKGESPHRLKDLGLEPGEVVPPTDVTFDAASSVSMDGEKVRLYRDDHQWSGAAKAYTSCPVVSVFDGKSGRDFWSKGRGGQFSYPLGNIKGGPALYIDGPYLNAVGLAYRPFSFRVFIAKPDSLTLTGRKSVLGGKQCLELELAPGGEAVQRLWVDPTRDYAIVRSFLVVRGRVITRMDIRYVNEPKEIRLDGWDSSQFGTDGKLEKAQRVRVTNCEINPPIESSEFDIDFPPGTKVIDQTTPIAPTYYIVRDGGRKRIIEPHELRIPYKELIATMPELAHGPNGWSLPSWPTVALGAVGLGAGVWFVWRRFRRRQHPV
jgi:hypothetical protein